MMSKTQDASEPIEDLLERGLDFYGRNDIDAAVQCWRRALALSPNHPQARDYLECAGVEIQSDPGAQVIDIEHLRTPHRESRHETPPLPDLPPSSSRDPSSRPSSARRRFVENLMHNGRYEEALSLLYKARASNPSDPKLSKSIRLMRERLAFHYTSQLKNLDLIPALSDSNKAIAAKLLKIDERQVLSLLDGISSYGDIIQSCALGRLSTLRILAKLRSEGLLLVLEPEEDSPPESRAISSRPPAPSPVTFRVNGSERPLMDSDFPHRDSARDSPRDSLLPHARNPDPYTELFSAATTAYLVRDFKKAAALFAKCREQRPEDRRVLHNLNALERKLNQ